MADAGQNTITDCEVLLITIRNKYNSLSNAAKRVADYLLSYYDEAVFLNISQIAERASVSEGTITKFARTVGFSGFQELKIAMARSNSLGSEKLEYYGDIPLESNAESICKSVFHQNIESISDTLKVIDTNAINQASEKIIRARKVDVYGMGTSSVAANYARLRFYRIGIISNVYSDPHMAIISSSLLKKEDVAIGVSNSGQSKDVVEALRIARENKATTICITNCDNSPIVKESDIVLFTASKDSQVLNESLCARVAEITLLDALYATIISKKKEKLTHNLDITAKAIQSLRISGK